MVINILFRSNRSSAFFVRSFGCALFNLRREKQSMKKFTKFISIVLITAILFTVFTISPLTIEAAEINISSVGDSENNIFDYKILPDGTAKITNYYSYNAEDSSHIIIPPSLDGFVVTSIGENAFINDDKIVNISFPDSILYIENDAFCGCTNIDNIDLPQNLISIGDNAFGACKSLTNITIPDSTTSIGNRSFYDCTNLENITLSTNVQNIGNSAFDNTAWYTNQPNGLVYLGNIAYKTKEEYPQNITIKTGTTVIADNAFNNCDLLESVSIPDTVKNIGNRAFSGCTNLTSITIPRGVTRIGEYGFYNCYSLNEIEIADTVTKIGMGAFLYTDWYYNQPDGILYIGKVAYDVKGEEQTNFNIKEGTIAIANDAFSWCEELKSITIPNSITTIGDRAFYHCDKLLSIDIPESVTCMGEYVFEHCTSLNRISLPNNTTKITSGMFSLCSSLDELTIPNTTTYIGDDALQGCNIKNITLPDSISYIGEQAFGQCRSLVSVSLPNSIQSLPDCIFWDCCSLEKIVIPDSVVNIGEVAFEGCESITKIDIPDSVIRIGYSTFQDCVNLQNVKLSNNLKEVPGYSFNNCQSIKSIVIPDSVKMISYDAFTDCTALKSVDLGKNISEISDDAFTNCSNIDTLHLMDKNEKTLYAFRSCKIKELIYKEGTTIISDGILYYNSTVEKIYIPSTTTKIGEYHWGVLSQYYGLKQIDVHPNNNTYCSINGVLYDKKMTTIYRCPRNINISEFIIPDSVSSIYKYAFNFAKNIKTLTISDKVSDIGDYSFSDCDIKTLIIEEGTKKITNSMIVSRTTLETIKLPNSIDKIDNPADSFSDGVFENCINLKEINITPNIKSIGNRAFYNCKSLVSLEIPNEVTTIGELCFGNCISINKIYIPDSVTKIIGRNPFLGCTNLENIEVSKNNINYTSIEGVLFNKSTTSLISYPCGKKAICYTTPNKTDCINSYAFSKCTNIQKIILNKVEYIGSFAFIECTNLKSIEASEYLNDIGNFAFGSDVDTGYENTVWYNNQQEGCTYVGNVLYNYKGDITEETNMVIKYGTKNLSSNFYNEMETWRNNSFQSASVPDTITELNGCGYCKVKKIFISNESTRITPIMVEMFDVSSIQEVIIPNSVKTIYERAFYNCKNIKEITIPSSVENIGEYALGYYYEDYYSDRPQKINDFKIFGKRGTAAENYAIDNGFTFVEIKEKPKITVDEEAKRCSVGSEITITASLNSDEYITEDIQWKSSNNNIAEIISTDSEFSSDKKIQKVVVKGKSKGNAYITATLPDGNEAIVSLLVTKKTCDIVLASYISNLTVAQGDCLTIHSALKTNTNDNYINGNFSVTMLNNDIAEISNVNKLDNYTEITIKGKKEGQSILCISDLDTGESIGAVITVAPDVYIYRCDQVPQEDRDNHIPSFYTAGLYVDNFKYTVNRQGSNRSYTLRMDVYNETSQYGAVDVFDAKGNWISSDPIDKSNGSLISGLGDMMTAVDGLVSDFGSLLFDKNNIFSDYRISQNKWTPIEVDVPAGGYIEISNNCNSSKGALMYNTADIAVFSAMEAANIALSSSAKESIAAASVKEIVKNAIDKSLYDNLDGNNVVKKLAEKITTNFTLNDINTHVENSSDAAIGFLKSINIDFAEVIKNCAKDLGVSIAESVVLEMAGTSGKVVKGLFTFNKYVKFALQLVHISKTTNGIPVRVYTLDNNDNLVSNGVIIKPTDKQLSTNFVCQAFQIYDGEDYETTKNLIDENNFKLYNIYMAENGSVEQPDSTVTVSIPLPEGYDSTRCSIYRVGENNNMINMNAYYENGYMIFTTDHFSLYAVVDENMQLLTGDVNGDGEISVVDATKLQKYLVGLSSLSVDQLAVADANGDGKISIIDATEIQKYLIGLVSSLG